MKEATGIVEKGAIKFSPSVQLPEGATVRIVRILWEEDPELKPLEREPLSAEEVSADIRWATGRRFEP
jgi:predicted DNA-binding antitoxin AbrB/MazE fold protein